MKQNFLDKAIGFISPSAGYKRAMYREATRSYYDAAQMSRENGRWNSTNTTAEVADTMDRNIIRARARDLERNSDFMENLVLPYINNVVGNGFTLQAKIKEDDENASELNKEIERLFKSWSRHKNCDIMGQQSFKELCETAIRRMRVDGGIIFVKVYDDRGEFPFKLQALEVDSLNESLNSIYMPNKNNVIGGIEIDEYNRPIKYHFKKVILDGYEQFEEDIAIDADRVMFLFMKNRPTQLREISPMAKTLKRIKDIDSFMEALQIKERVSACLSAFITQVDNAGFGGGRNNNRVDADSGYNQQTLAPGMIMKLKPGEGVQVVNPTNGAAVIGGIEIDKYNRPVKYHFKKVSLDGYEQFEEDIAIDADRVMFLFMKIRPTLLREISPMATTLTRIKDIDSFMEALQIKERVSACLSAFITQVDNAVFGGGRNNNRVDADSGYNQQTLAPGMIMKLKPGEGVQVVNPTNGAAKAEAYIQTQKLTSKHSKE